MWMKLKSVLNLNYFNYFIGPHACKDSRLMTLCDIFYSNVHFYISSANNNSRLKALHMVMYYKETTMISNPL